MKGAYRDPVDHARTTQPHAGESFIDTLWLPGLLLIALGVAGLAGVVAAPAVAHEGHDHAAESAAAPRVEIIGADEGVGRAGGQAARAAAAGGGGRLRD